MIAYFHLPGLFEFYEFYKEFLPLFFERREFFYEWCDIGSIYGAPTNLIWGGGRVGFGEDNEEDVVKLMKEYGISSRLTFSNSFIKNGVIIYSDLLLEYISKNYPKLYFVSSTTKVITDFDEFTKELDRSEFDYVVPDFRLNKRVDELGHLNEQEKNKVEFLINECCDFNCLDRKACYENVSLKSLGENVPDHVCKSPNASEGYVFSRAMKNPGFISLDDIKNIYMPLGFSNYKIEGRSLGSALILEFILYYMTKPEYQLNVREKIYLNSSLDLF